MPRSNAWRIRRVNSPWPSCVWFERWPQPILPVPTPTMETRKPLLPSATWLVGVIEPRITRSDAGFCIASARQRVKIAAPVEVTPAVAIAVPKNSRRLSFLIPTTSCINCRKHRILLLFGQERSIHSFPIVSSFALRGQTWPGIGAER